MHRNTDFLFEQLVEKIESLITPQSRDPKMFVTLINDDLNPESGIDAGGLARTFLDELFQHIVTGRLSGIQCQMVAGAARPAKIDYDSENPKNLIVYDPENPEKFTLNSEGKQQYESLGKLFMYCYNSNSGAHYDRTYHTGKYFDSSLFAAIKCLKASDLDKPFHELSPALKKRMAKILLYGEESEPEMKKIKKFLSKQPHELNDEDVIEAAYFAFIEGDWEVGYDDPESIRQHWAELKANIEDNVVNMYMWKMLPIQAIARGMHSNCWVVQANSQPHQRSATWDNEFASENGVTATDLSEKIQGKVNRQHIANQIKWAGGGAPSPAISTKITWLKEWLQDTDLCSEADVTKFLRFVTGSSSLAPGKEIKVKKKSGANTPLPNIHSCSFEIEFSPQHAGVEGGLNDFTKEGFIKSMKEAIAVTGFDFG